MTNCKMCGESFLAAKVGRPRIFCSARCKDKSRQGSEKRNRSQRASRAQYYQRNKEKIRAKNIEWIKAHPQKMSEYARAWEIRNPERVSEIRKTWRQLNQEARRNYKKEYKIKYPEKEREYRQINREKLNEYAKKWLDAYRKNHREEYRYKQRQHFENNPHTYIARNQRRRTRKTQAGGAYTKEQWTSLVEANGNKCLCCGAQDVKLTVDHIVPVMLGGTSNIENIQPLCKSCNSRKRNKTIDYREVAA